MDVVSVTGLVKRYDEVLALDHFDVHIASGEIFGLLGPNGSGKTTSINCMLALLSYDRGSIELFGEPMAATRYDLKRRIGMVPQQVAVFNELTVYENVDYFCSLYVANRARRRELVREALEFVELEEFASFRPRKLSGGLLRRLNIACGIAHKPELIFFDEPTVAVDPQSRNAILAGIARLRDEGATVVYTSHYMEEVEQICDRVMIMDHGRALAQGTCEELKRSVKMGERIVVELEGSSARRRPARTGAASPDPSAGGARSVRDAGNTSTAPTADASAPLSARELDRLRALPHVLDVQLADSLLTVSCAASEHNLTDVLAALRADGARVGRITCAPPTLNDVFLEITGRELRDTSTARDGVAPVAPSAHGRRG